MARVRIKVPFEQIEEGNQPAPSSTSVSEQSSGQLSGRKPTGSVTLSRRTLLIASACFILILILAVRIDRDGTDKTGNNSTSTTVSSADSEAQKYYDEVSKFIELPSNEKPQILNVSDANKVKQDNMALADIEDGDKMLFFTKSRKLVVYRPSTKKIVAAISLTPPQSTKKDQ